MSKKAILDRESSRSASRSPPAKEDPNSSVKTQTAFVGKLYTMVEDPCIQTLISWSKTGTTFLVHEPTEFSKKVLPIYFKHNNWQSFVRQLNMYGFHKVNNVFHTNSPIDGQPWEFEHSDFRKGAQELLSNIKRKAPKSNSQAIPQSASEVPTNQPKPIRIATPEATTDLDPRDAVIEQLTQKVSRLEQSLEKMHNSYEHLSSEVSSYQSAQAKSFQLIARMTDMLQSLAKDDLDDFHAYRKRKFDNINDIKYEVANLMNSEPSGYSIALPPKESTYVIPPTRIPEPQSDFSTNQPHARHGEGRHLTPPFHSSTSSSYGQSYLPSIQTSTKYPLSPSSNPRDGKSSSPVFLPCANITLPPLAEMASRSNYNMPLSKQPRLA
ncbi:Flocculation suppression protein [Basidiobolus ranarum]|uniref:Flocculation suppression protein n=1 Tax=Basidiobolus ranarum TaxID=34480 RepID=A0ABR2VVJ4_9FUNG